MKSLALAGAFLLSAALPAAAVDPDPPTPAAAEPEKPQTPPAETREGTSEPRRNMRGEVVSPEIQAEVERNIANQTVNFDGTDKPIGEVLQRIAPEDRALAEKIIAAGRTPIFDPEGNFLGSNDPTNQMSILGSAERETFAKELAAAGAPQNPAPVTAADAATQAAIPAAAAAAAANAALGAQGGTPPPGSPGGAPSGRVPQEGEPGFVGPVRPPPAGEDPGANPPPPTDTSSPDYTNQMAGWLMSNNDPNKGDRTGPGSGPDSGFGPREAGSASNNPVTGAGARSDDGQNGRVGSDGSGGSEIKCRTRADCEAVAESYKKTAAGAANAGAFDAPRPAGTQSTAALANSSWAGALGGTISQIGGALGELLGIKSKSESAVANVTGDNATGTVLHDGGDTGFDGQGPSRAAVENPPLCEGKDFCWNNQGKTVLPPS